MFKHKLQKHSWAWFTLLGRINEFLLFPFLFTVSRFWERWTRAISPDSFIPHITCNAKLTPFGNPSVPPTAPCLVQHKFFTIFLFLRPFARRDATITREDSEDFVPNKHCSAMSMLTRNSCFRLVLLSTFWWVFKFSSKKMIFNGYMLRFKQK